jgi:hypothetical protein
MSCIYLMTLSCFPLTDPSVLLVSVPKFISQLTPVLVTKKIQEGQREMDWLNIFLRVP